MKLLILCSSLICIFNCAIAEPRVWTLVSGKNVKAEFISVMGDNIVMKTMKGKVRKIPRALFSEDDLNYINLNSPPELTLKFTKTTKQRVFPPTHIDREKIPRSQYYTFNLEIAQTSIRKYDYELIAEFFVIGAEIGGDKRIFLGYEKLPFYLTDGKKSILELSMNRIELLDFDINQERRGKKYSGFVVLVTDSRGEVIAYETSSKELFRNVENLRQIPIGKTFDDTYKRCFPSCPKRRYY